MVSMSFMMLTDTLTLSKPRQYTHTRHGSEHSRRGDLTQQLHPNITHPYQRLWIK